MRSHFEESLQRDIARISAKVQSMAALDERALRDCVTALQQRNRQLAYTVILRDQRIDEMEREVDELCLNFLVRQQPAGGPLRMAYATIRINLELERIGDYAESIARQILKLIGQPLSVPIDRFVEIAELSIPMLHSAVKAFVEKDAQLARSTMKIEEDVDVLRSKINAEVVQWRHENRIPLEALTPMLTIARRFERVSDQAKNICQEALYVCTGEYTKHQEEGVIRWLFVDDQDATLSVIAEAIANSLNLRQFEFRSAGITAGVIDRQTVEFLNRKGLTAPRSPAQKVSELPDLDKFQVVVTLGDSVRRGMPPAPPRTVYFDWTVEDPSGASGSAVDANAAYEKAYESLRAHILDLVEAILGQEINLTSR